MVITVMMIAVIKPLSTLILVTKIAIISISIKIYSQMKIVRRRTDGKKEEVDKKQEKG